MLYYYYYYYYCGTSTISANSARASVGGRYSAGIEAFLINRRSAKVCGVGDDDGEGTELRRWRAYVQCEFYIIIIRRR